MSSPALGCHLAAVLSPPVTAAVRRLQQMLLLKHLHPGILATEAAENMYSLFRWDC